MNTEMYLKDSEIHLLRSLIGKKLIAYGSAKPGVDLGYAIEDAFIEFEDALVSVREDFVTASVCGEIGDYLALRVDVGYRQRREADIAGGVYYFFKGERLKSVRVHRARLTRSRDTGIESFDHDALLEFEFETGSLWFLKDELSTPLIQMETSKVGERYLLPNPAEGWPNSIGDIWYGDWVS